MGQCEGGDCPDLCGLNGEPPRDDWSERRAHQCWRREHRAERKALFTPLKVSGGPTTAHSVGEFRVYKRDIREVRSALRPR